MKIREERSKLSDEVVLNEVDEVDWEDLNAVDLVIERAECSYLQLSYDW